jgi:HD-like signal output (HDOD) protein
MVRRAGALYTLPAVAVEVLELTNHPKVDVAALKSCIERDPALTAKLLRVVNSSLFGLPREVCDLNQALGLLGTKPLKMLVLGFSLPENLFLEAAREQLDWYWNSTLVRAVAAREISEQLFARPGDDAFVAGLLQDLGVLALLGQLGAPYAALLAEAMASRADLQRRETIALGFDHTQLTAGLLEHWNMPSTIVRAVAEPREWRRWARSRAGHAPLVRVLHLAELFTQLVGQHRLTVLPDLLEAGAAYCDLDTSRLHALVGALEPKVKQLAGVLSLNFEDGTGGRDYVSVLTEAHQQLASVAESAAPALCVVGDALADAELDDEHEAGALRIASELREAVERFLRHRPAVRKPVDPSAEATPPIDDVDASIAPLRPDVNWQFNGPARDDFRIRLTLEAGQCRSARQPLSVVVLSVGRRQELLALEMQMIDRLLDAACRDACTGRARVEAFGEGRRVIVMPGRDRGEAVTAARAAVEHLRKLIAPLDRAGRLPACTPAAGVASVVETPARNFEVQRLLDTAERCLAAALAAGGVKSLEVS